jgi:hypothetical protein
VAYLSYYHGIYLEELQKTTKTLSQDCRCLSRDSNRDPPEYKSEALPLGRLTLYQNLLLFCSYTDEVPVHYCHDYSINTNCTFETTAALQKHVSALMLKEVFMSYTFFTLPTTSFDVRIPLPFLVTLHFKYR